MKKLLSLLLVLMGTVYVSAQNYNVSIVGGTSLAGLCKVQVGGNFATTFNISENLQLGAGVGLHFYKPAWRELPRKNDYANEFSIPIAAIIKYNMPFIEWGKCFPFIMAETGYNLALGASVEDRGEWIPSAPEIDPVSKGFFIEPQLGIDLEKKFYISVGVNFRESKWSNRVDTYFPDGSEESRTRVKKGFSPLLAFHLGIKL